MSTPILLLLLCSLCCFALGQQNYTIVPLVVPTSQGSYNSLWEGAFNPNGTIVPYDSLGFRVDLPSVSSGHGLSMYPNVDFEKRNTEARDTYKKWVRYLEWILNHFRYLVSQNSSNTVISPGSQITIDLHNHDKSTDNSETVNCIGSECDDYNLVYPEFH